MHIADGVLSLPVLTAGGVVAVAGITVGLRRMPWDRVMGVALLSSAFFAASLIHVRLGTGSVHLILNGLLGALLGWASVPAIFTALLFQALLFQFGGLAVLGVNTCIMALPALVFGLGCRPLFRYTRFRTVAAFCCGSLAVAGSTALGALALALSGDEFLASAAALFFAHIPVMLIEGIVTAIAVNFLVKVRPDLLLYTTTVASEAGQKKRTS